MNERIWDYTALDTFLTCRKKFYWRMVKHLTPVIVSPALNFGSAIHEALDTYYTYYKEYKLTDGIEKAIEKFGEIYEDVEGDELRTIANGIKLLENYAIVYKHEPFKMLGKPEVGFVFPLGNILCGGRLDLPVEWDGELFILEHKTTSSLRYNYSRQFELSMQVTIYTLAAEEYLGRKCQGCIINALEPWKVVKRVTPKTKRMEDHYVRIPITRTEKQKDALKIEVQQMVRDITLCHERNEWYPNGHACFLYNTNCAYKDLCMYGEDERIIKRDFIVEPWEPYKELMEVKKDVSLS